MYSAISSPEPDFVKTGLCFAISAYQSSFLFISIFVDMYFEDKAIRSMALSTGTILFCTI
jgi:hypothetical protein